MSIKLSACSIFVAAFFGLALTATTPAHAFVEAGMLSCRSCGTGRLCCRIGTRVRLRVRACLRCFAQFYHGTVSRFGAQIGFTNDVAMGWIVLAATSRVGAGAVAGGYVGVTGGATVGVGVGANGLVGGLNNSFALQPVSVEGQTGLNVIATVTGLDLQPARPMRHHRRHHRR